MWLDSRHTTNDIPFTLTARWFGPFTVLQVKGAQATLDLPYTFGKAHRQVNISRLKFFESRDSKLGPANVRPQPLWGHDGVLITKSNAFVMLGATRVLMSCGWNGREMINLKTVGWHGLPCYRMSHTWYMRLRLASLERALLSVLEQQCVTVCCHCLHQHCQSRHFTLVKLGVLWLFENPIVWEWSCLVSCHHLRRHCRLQIISLITLGGLRLVAAKVERE